MFFFTGPDTRRSPAMAGWRSRLSRVPRQRADKEFRKVRSIYGQFSVGGEMCVGEVFGNSPTQVHHNVTLANFCDFFGGP